MIRVLIIEDEDIAANRLQKLVLELLPEADILPVQDSISSTVNWLQNNEMPQLIFADIQLADGPSFDIFKTVEINAPVIFTTAYDAYAIDAFKLYAIDYILKPVKKEELRQSIEKYKKYFMQDDSNELPTQNLAMLMKNLQQPVQYKQRFVIRLGEHMHTVETEQVAYFYTENKANFIVTKAGKKFPGDYNLDQLEGLVNPKAFFRINRQFIISYAAIDSMLTYSKARVLIKLNPPSKLETIVSTERAASFKAWLAGE